MHRLLACLVFLLPLASSAADVELGMPVPDIALPSLIDGETVRLSDLRGKVVYIDFWASWCGPCRKSLPALDRIRNDQREDFEVFAINVDENPEDGLRFLKRYPVSFPVLSDPSAEFPPRFGLQGMPTSYIVDRDGLLRYVHEGYRDGDAKKISAVIAQLIAE